MLKACQNDITHYPCIRMFSSVLYPLIHLWNHLQLKGKKSKLIKISFFYLFE